MLRTFVGKVVSLLFNTWSKFVIAFLPRSKRLLVLCLQSLSTVVLEPKKIKSVTVSTFSPSFARKWWDWMSWFSFFECWVLSQLFHSPLSLSSRGSLGLDEPQGKPKNTGVSYLEYSLSLLQGIFLTQESNWGLLHCRQILYMPSHLRKTYSQRTSCETPGWMSYKLESRQVGEISASFSYAEDTTLMAESEEELKSLLMRMKEESEKLP